MDIRLAPSKLSGKTAAISSKSDAHRILIAAALSDKPTVIYCNSASDDIRATENCLNALGAKIKTEDGIIEVEPIKTPVEKAELDCGESGSTLRFLLPVAGALGVRATLTGRGRLPSRPITPLRRVMENCGVEFSAPWEFPIRIEGQLTSGEYTLKGNVSSQFVTGLLFALPLLSGDSKIRLIPPVESKPYINMTLNTLSKFGIEIIEGENEYTVKGGQKYISPSEITVEGDWSNAAFFLTAGALGEGVTVTGLNAKSLQGDRAVVDILKKMGAAVKINDGGVTVSGGKLSGTQIDASDIPDLVPILSVAAAAAKSGVTTVTHAERLRLKECDRLAAVNECLNNIGAVAAETDDGIIVWSGDKIRGGEVFSFNDHRIVMSMAIAAAVCEGDIIIKNAEAVNKSYPDFFKAYNGLGGKADVINTKGE